MQYDTSAYFQAVKLRLTVNHYYYYMHRSRATMCLTRLISPCASFHTIYTTYLLLPTAYLLATYARVSHIENGRRPLSKRVRYTQTLRLTRLDPNRPGNNRPLFLFRAVLSSTPRGCVDIGLSSVTLLGLLT